MILPLYFLVMNMNEIYATNPPSFDYQIIEKTGHTLPNCIAEWTKLSLTDKENVKCWTLDEYNKAIAPVVFPPPPPSPR